MVFCHRYDCRENDDGICESCENITIDESGTCMDYVEFFGEDYLDDVERSEISRVLSEGGEQ